MPDDSSDSSGPASQGDSSLPLSRLSAFLDRIIHFQHRHVDADDGGKLAPLQTDQVAVATRHQGLFRSIPALGLGIFSGTLVDRYDRRKLLLTTQCLLGTLALVLGVLDHSDSIRPWHIYTITFLSAAVGSCDGPTRQALFPSLVPKGCCPTRWRGIRCSGKAQLCSAPRSVALRLALWAPAGAFYANAASLLSRGGHAPLMRLHVKARPESQRPRHFLAEAQEGGFSYIVFSGRSFLG